MVKHKNINESDCFLILTGQNTGLSILSSQDKAYSFAKDFIR